MRAVIIAAAITLACFTCTVGLAFFLAAPSGRWDLLPSMILSGGRLRPAAQQLLSTAARLDIRPMPELRLTAPPGALDKDRVFKVKRASEAELAQFDRMPAFDGLDPKAAFQIDAGMQPTERFPGELTVTIDLAKLNISHQDWGRVAAVIVHPGIDPQRLCVTVDHGKAAVRLRHNQPWLVVTIAAAAYKGIQHVTGYEKEGSDTWSHAETDKFSYHWRGTDPPADPAAAADFVKKRQEIADTADAMQRETDPQKAAELRRRLSYLRLTFEGRYPPAVQLAKLSPVAVQDFARAFESAYEYLIDYRKFKKPGFLIDVYFRMPWPHGSAAALTRHIGLNNTPYIDIREEPSPDERQISAVHELFHVVQKGYRTTGDWTSYGWFDEATALVLEGDAQSWFLGRNLARVWRRTERQWMAYQRALDDPPAGDKEIIDHGYSASYFLEWLRDKYYKANRDQFLKSLYDDSSSWTGGTTKSLMRVTSNDTDKIGADYREFVAGHTAEILSHGLVPPERKTRPVTESNPSVEWSHKPFAALSACSWWMRIPGVPMDLKSRTIVVIQEVSQPANSLTLWSPDAQHTTSLAALEAVAKPAWNSGNGVLDVQRVEPYEGPGLASGSSLTRMFVMIPPKDPPTCTTTDDSLRVQWRQSRLAELDLVREYRIKVQPPTGPQVTITTTENDTTIPLADLRALAVKQDKDALNVFQQQVSRLGDALRDKIDSQDLRDLWEIREFNVYMKSKGQQSVAAPWQIRYQEVANTNTFIAGGESPPCLQDIAASDLDPGNFDPSGHWLGRVVFTDLWIDMNLQSSGGGLTGSGALGHNRQNAIVGKWDSGLNGWYIEAAPSNAKNQIKPEDLPPILRMFTRLPTIRFSHQRLLMQLPPAIFTRTNSEPAPVRQTPSSTAPPKGRRTPVE